MTTMTDMLYLLGGVPLPQNPRRIYVVTPAPRDGWRELVNQTPTARPEDTPEWVDVLCRPSHIST